MTKNKNLLHLVTALMLKNLPHLSGDPLFNLIKEYESDQRKNKVNLIIGVYCDEHGKTPVMEAVRSAEIQLAHQASSKAYKSLSGNIQFNEAITHFLLGNNKQSKNHYTIQTVGGTGALKVLADLIATLSPSSTVWNTEPGYINHKPIMEGAGLKVAPFTWQMSQGCLDLETCLKDLETAKEADILLLHGCCHNPTGIDPSLEQWQILADFCKAKKLIPLIDIAYQGFASTPEQDAAGLKLFVDQLETVFIATSCSKNMGLYCERTGAAIVVSNSMKDQSSIRTLVESITRAYYSMPPNHGAAIASILLSQPSSWLEELENCRHRIQSVRSELTKELTRLGASEEVLSISEQNGMFSMLPLSADQMKRLRHDCAIYGLPNGRINLAGLKKTDIPFTAESIVKVSS